MNEYKQVIVLRIDLGISVGKMIVQACHAACSALLAINREDIVRKWISQGSKKVVLKVKGEEKLLNLYRRAVEMGLPCSLVRDAGLTELPPGTSTALAIGPEESQLIDKITGSLSLLKGTLLMRKGGHETSKLKGEDRN